MSVSTAVKVAVAGLFGAIALAGTAHADSISFLRDGDIWVASPDGAKQVRLTYDGGYTYQSQADNGDFIALHGRRLRLIGRDGSIKADFSTPVSGERTDNTSSYFLGPFKPEISPDGKKVAYAYHYVAIENKPGCVPEGTPNCQNIRHHTGIGYSRSDRLTGWDEPGLGRQSGWTDPSWIGNDTVLISDKSVQLNLDAMLDHPGDGNDTIQGWFLDENSWYVRDGEVARSGNKAAFVTTRPKGAHEDLDLDDRITVYKMNGPAPALPSPCFSYGNPQGSYKSPTFSPNGARIAFEDSVTPGFAHILVGSIPSLTKKCVIPETGAVRILENARQPDWGPANVPTAPRIKKPIVTTGEASNISATNARLTGTVDPEGARTSYHFQYGKTTSYGSTTPDQDASSGRDPVDASADLTGLAPNTTYHYRLVATNEVGTTYGPDRTFTTPKATKPGAATVGTAGVTASAATLRGKVNPNGSPTKYKFQYGLTTEYGTTTKAQDAGAGTTSVEYKTDLSKLEPNTTYHFRIVATNQAGTTNGTDRTFTTPAAVPPAVTTGAADAIGRTSARLNGSVTPKGMPTTYHFEWGTTTAYGKKTKGANAGAGTQAVPVQFEFANLKAGTTYHYRLVATNAAGTTVGANRTFTTEPPPPPPTVTTGDAAYVSQTYAQLSATINPQGSATTFQFEYGPTKTFGTTTPEVDAGSGANPVNRAVDVDGLTPNTTYYYRVIAKSGAGTSVGATRSFKTAQVTGPVATTGAAGSITRTGAKLNGTINPRGEFTSYRFEYGLTTDYGQTTPEGFLWGGTSKVSVSEVLTGLQPGKTYHYRLVADGETNSSVGADMTFTTPA